MIHKMRCLTSFTKRGIFALFFADRDYDNKYVEREIKTNWDKILRIFDRDEKQNLSPELCTVASNIYGSILIGAGYTGFLYSRQKMYDYIENNMGTKYLSRMDAEKRLIHKMTAQFVRGAVYWGIRISFFTAIYSFIYVSIGAIRENHSAWNLIGAGIIAGGFYKIPLGIKGIFSGSVVGGFSSALAATVIQGLLTLTGISFNDIMLINYRMINKRDSMISNRQSLREEKEITAEMIELNTNAVDFNTFIEQVEESPEKEETNKNNEEKKV